MAGLIGRQSEPLDYKAGGNTIRFDDPNLPPAAVIDAVLIKRTGNFAVVGGTGAGTVYSDAAFRSIEEMVVLDGGKPVSAIKGEALGKLLRYWLDEYYTQTVPANLAVGSTQAVDFRVFYPFYQPQTEHPNAAALDAVAFPDAALQVKWAAASALARQADGALSFADMTAAVTYHIRYGEPRPAGGFDRLVFGYTEKVVTQSNSKFALSLDNLTRGRELRAVLIEAESGGTDGAGYQRDDSLISEVTLIASGREPWRAMAWDELRDENKRIYSLSTLESGSVLLDAAADDRNAFPGGLLFTPPSGAIPALRLNVAKQAGECRIRVTTVEVVRGNAGI